MEKKSIYLKPKLKIHGDLQKVTRGQAGGHGEAENESMPLPS